MKETKNKGDEHVFRTKKKMKQWKINTFLKGMIKIKENLYSNKLEMETEQRN